MPGLGVVLFLAIFAAAMFAVAAGFKLLESQRRKRVGRILRSVDAIGREPKTVVLVAGSGPAPGGWRGRLEETAIYRRMERKLRAASLEWNPGRVLLTCAGLGLAGALVGWQARLFLAPAVGALAAGALSAFVPFFLIERRRKKRIERFETQFPEALDFLARSVRAGHALSVSLEMLATETPEPLRTEFRRVSGEQSLGSSLDAALKNLAERVPLLDVRFFVSAVLLQKETGGNLSEILNKLSYVIRERFRIRGQVRALTAHGRITALVLTLMPLAVAGLLSVVAPGYISGMLKDPAGRFLLGGSAVAQVLGYFSMQKIINIKV